MHSIWFRRFAPRLLIGTALAAVLIAVGIYPRINQNALHVLCANNYHSCSALAAEYEKLSGENVQFVRLPTSQALEKLAANPELPEFDVFIGGPAEAYEQARISGLIQPHRLHDLPDSRFATAYWIGTYGGILAFCINPQHTNIENAPQQWQDLTKPEFKRKIVLPSPLTSGTAGTMLGTLNSRFPNRADFRKYLQSLHANALTYTDSGTHLANLIAADRAQIAVTFAPYCESYPHRRLKVIFLPTAPDTRLALQRLSAAEISKLPKIFSALQYQIEARLLSQALKTRTRFPQICRIIYRYLSKI
ncbi:substrate-binding domain-containing protein [Arcanobacterium hippocoleae]